MKRVAAKALLLACSALAAGAQTTVTVNNLPAVSSATGSDIIAVWQTGGSAPHTRGETVDQIKTYVLTGYAPAWSAITGTPTTLAGYGITDAYTKSESDGLYQPISSNLSLWSAVAPSSYQAHSAQLDHIAANSGTVDLSGTTLTLGSTFIVGGNTYSIPAASGGGTIALSDHDNAWTGSQDFSGATIILGTISGTITVANGGTGQASLTAGNILTGNGTSALGSITPGSDVMAALQANVNAAAGLPVLDAQAHLIQGTAGIFTPEAYGAVGNGLSVQGISITTGTETLTLNNVASTTGTTASSSNLITSLGSLTGIYAGVEITGTGIPDSTTVTKVFPAKSITGTLTSGSAVVTSISSGSLYPGAPVTGTGIPAGTTLVSVYGGPSTLTLSANATSSGSSVTLTFPASIQISSNATATGSSVSLAFPSPSLLTNVAVGTPITVYGAGAASADLTTTVAAVTNGTTLTLATNASTTLSNGYADLGHDDTSAIQSAITAAQAASGTVLLAANKCYRITSPLSITSTMNLRGGGVQALGGSFTAGGNGYDYPTLAPYVTGSTLLMTTAATDAIYVKTFPGSGPNITDLGILFGDKIKFTNTGSGIHFDALPQTGLCSPNFNPSTAQDNGSFYFELRNLDVYGQDGNHYAFYLLDVLYASFQNLYSWGGGGMCVEQNNAGAYAGNWLLNNSYFALFAPGTAQGIYIKTNPGSSIGFFQMNRAQVEKKSDLGYTPNANQRTLLMNAGCSFASSGTWSSGGTTVTGLSDTTAFNVGDYVNNNSYFPAWDYITAITSNSITVAYPTTGPGSASSFTVQSGGAVRAGCSIIGSQFEDLTAGLGACMPLTTVNTVIAGCEFIPKPTFMSLAPIRSAPVAGTPLYTSDGISFGVANAFNTMIRLLDGGSGSHVGFGRVNGFTYDFYSDNGATNVFRFDQVSTSDGVTLTYTPGPQFTLDGQFTLPRKDNFINGGSAPTIVAGTGAGTSPTVTIIGTNGAGEITVTTGTGCSASATLATITLSSSGAFPTHAEPVLTPENAAAASLTGAGLPYCPQGGTTSWTMSSNGTPLADSTTYIWRYTCVGY